MPPITIDDIYVYIFSWKHVTANAQELFARVSAHFPQTYLINCDENTPIPGAHVIQRDDSYYYGGQFNTALHHMPNDGGKILSCIVGDVSPEADWARIAENAVAAFNRGDVGIYAPDVYYTYWVAHGPQIADTLYEVENTDCTCWFLSPALTTPLRALDYFALSNYGWGIDKIFCGEARAAGLHVARDYSVRVTQPKGTAYSERTALIQMNELMAAYNALRSTPNISP
jgi:hypothetical protein